MEEKVEALQRDVELLQREVQRRNQELMGALTILCLPMSTNRKLEVGFSVLRRLPDDVLKLIIDRYTKEGIRSDMTFDQIMEPMIKSLGFERLWSIIGKEKIREEFGEWALARWTEMSKDHGCEA
ncbi:hypothetical protein [Nitrososphaera sp.]|uniref:hypothetical protein n=1 Tax=Nitrososphaera sp. TaxID=1971748 RepID=UPI00307CF888